MEQMVLEGNPEEQADVNQAAAKVLAIYVEHATHASMPATTVKCDGTNVVLAALP